MLIDPHAMHKHIKPEDRDALLVVQVITWIEESHFWRPLDPKHPRKVTCAWCGAIREDYFVPLTGIPMEELKVCPGNPVLKDSVAAKDIRA